MGAVDMARGEAAAAAAASGARLVRRRRHRRSAPCPHCCENVAVEQLLEHARSEASQVGFLERIDFVLLSPAAAARAQRVAMPRGDALDEVSDHYPVVVDLAPRKFTTTINGSAKL